MVFALRHSGYVVNRKRVRRLMRERGIQGVSQGPDTSQGGTLAPVCGGENSALDE